MSATTKPRRWVQKSSWGNWIVFEDQGGGRARVVLDSVYRDVAERVANYG